MKAIILTYVSLSKSDMQTLRETKIFKLALNQHAEELIPDKRIISDYVLDTMCKNFTQKIISVRDRLRYNSNRVEYFNGEFRGSTIVSAIQYLTSKNYNEILIVGDNTVNNQTFQSEVNTEIAKLIKKTKIYQYTNGNFNLPVIGILEFCKQ